MKLYHVFIPLSLGSAVALAGWIVFEPGFVESTPEVIPMPASALAGNPHSVVVGKSDIAIDPETGFAVAAFPPTMPDQPWHQDAWFVNNCLDCHETGVQDAPMIQHIGLPDIALASKCRSCHVLIEGEALYVAEVDEFDPITGFASWAFPPMMPNNENHDQAWGANSCLLCHEDGTRNAPLIRHEGLPKITLDAKCRTCHVQVRSNESSPWPEIEIEYDDE